MSSSRSFAGPTGGGGRTKPDRQVRVRSRGALAQAALLATLITVWLAGRPAPAHACSYAAPGIYSRVVWPRSDRIPTNPRLVVRYQAFGPEALAGLGDDLVLLDGETPVPSTVEASGQTVVLRPSTNLLPDHAYQLADRRTLPCETGPSAGVVCALGDVPQPFATFLTGSEADTTAPTFGGITAISPGEHTSCNSSACCGPYEVVYVNFTWNAAADDLAGGAVAYRVYRRENSSLQLIADHVDGTQLSGVAVCSGTWGAPVVTPGRYVVRAFDAAGNEDSNVVERTLGDPCLSGGSGSGSGGSGGSGGGSGSSGSSGSSSGGCTVVGTPASSADVVAALFLLGTITVGTRRRNRPFPGRP